MKTARLIALILVSIMTMSLLSSCIFNPYNAELINGDATELIDEGFYHENYTCDAYYLIDGEYVRLNDPSYPKERIFVITSSEEYDAIFSENANINVDFSKEMLIVYTFTAQYTREIRINGISIKDNECTLSLKMIKPFTFFWLIGDHAMPYQRYVVVKMNKVDVKKVNVTLKI